MKVKLFLLYHLRFPSHKESGDMGFSGGKEIFPKSKPFLSFFFFSGNYRVEMPWTI